MAYLFPTDEIHIHRKFDLKGSSQGRSINEREKLTMNENITLKDLDLDFVFRMESHQQETLLRYIHMLSACVRSLRTISHSGFQTYFPVGSLYLIWPFVGEAIVKQNMHITSYGFCGDSCFTDMGFRVIFKVFMYNYGVTPSYSYQGEFNNKIPQFGLTIQNLKS